MVPDTHIARKASVSRSDVKPRKLNRRRFWDEPKPEFSMDVGSVAVGAVWSLVMFSALLS